MDCANGSTIVFLGLGIEPIPVADLEHDKIVKRLDELQHCLSGCHRARGFLDIERGREQSIRNA